MSSAPSLISIIVIGRNTKKNLFNLLQSINKTQNHKYIKEIIYVDDASLDGSKTLFKDFVFPFEKIGVNLTTNKGRAFARQKGAEAASGDWFLFLNSNVVVDSLIINAYIQSIRLGRGVAYAGLVNYSSEDLSFENYLNNNPRIFQ